MLENSAFYKHTKEGGFIKRYGNIYPKIYDYDNLKLAHRNARKNKTFYSEVRKVDKDIDSHLIQLQNMLIWKTYKTSDYEIFTIMDKEKEREIYKLPYFPDRICQWAIMLQIEDVFMEVFTDFTCASLPGRGIHYALDLETRYLKNVEDTKYCLKIDVKKFFPSVDHGTLKSLLRRKFKDLDLLWLLDEIIDSIDGERGLPIGNYTSQYFANFYLAYFDHWLKEEKGIKYVIRYMDDIVIFSDSKEYLHKLRKDIEEYLMINLKLKLKENWQVFPTRIRGVDFVGYRHFGDYILLRKSTAKRMKRKLRKIYSKCINGGKLTYAEWCSINSYKGWLVWCNSYNLYKKWLKPLEPYCEEYYNRSIASNKNNKGVGGIMVFEDDYNGLELDSNGNVINAWIGDSRGGTGSSVEDVKSGKITLDIYVYYIKSALKVLDTCKRNTNLKDICMSNMNEHWRNIVVFE